MAAGDLLKVVAPSFGAATVTLTGVNGTNPTLYTDSYLTTTVANPFTVASLAATTVFVPQGSYTLSVKVAGVEGADVRAGTTLNFVAAGQGQQATFDYSALDNRTGGVWTALTPVSIRPGPGPFSAFFGDSIGAGTGASNFAYAFMPQALQMVGGFVGRYDSIQSGVAGNTSAQVLARMDATLALGPQVAVILIGTNDAAQSVPVATFAANVTAMVRKCKARGVPVILCPAPPRAASATSAQHTFTQAYAWWIRLNAPSLGCELAETHNVLVDVTNTNGAMLSTYDSGDGTHPNDAGHQKMAVEVAKALKRLTARVSPYAVVGAPGIFNVLGDTLNARAAVIGTGWFEQGGGTGTAPTYSFVNDTSSQLVAGRWAQMDFDGTASGGVRRLASSVTAGASTFAVGDLILATAKFQIEDTSGTWQTDVVAHNATATFTAVNQSAAAIPNGSAGTGCAGVLNAAGFYDFQVAFVFPVPAATTQILPWYSLTVPTGKHYKMRVGELGLVNLTLAGLNTQFNWGTAPVNG
jgi:lysophospholipase L1-like esterase